MRHLIFGDEFNQIISAGILPKSLTLLVIGSKYIKHIKHNTYSRVSKYNESKRAKQMRDIIYSNIMWIFDVIIGITKLESILNPI